MTENETLISLLRECYDILEEVQSNEWVIRDSKSITIPGLLIRMRLHIYPPVPFDEVPSIKFRCIACQTTNLEVIKTGEWDYIECLCKKRYRVVWQHENVDTYIVPMEGKA